MITTKQIKTELKKVDDELRREVLHNARISELIRLQNAKIHLLQTMIEIVMDDVQNLKNESEA